MTTSVRPATVADLDAVEAVDTACFGRTHWSRQTFADSVSAAGRTVLVAEAEGVVVGLAVVRVVGDSADLERIAVLPAHRGRRNGDALLASAVALLAGAGAERLLLEVAVDNQAAITFYSHRGFVEIARRPRYYDGRVDAIVMHRPL